MGTYVISTRRSARSEGVTVVQRLLPYPSVTIRGAANPDRVVVETTPTGAQEIQNNIGDKVVVEPETFYYPNN